MNLAHHVTFFQSIQAKNVDIIFWFFLLFSVLIFLITKISYSVSEMSLLIQSSLLLIVNTAGKFSYLTCIFKILIAYEVQPNVSHSWAKSTSPIPKAHFSAVHKHMFYLFVFVQSKPRGPTHLLKTNISFHICYRLIF